MGLSYEDIIVSAAAQQIGRPYIWGGKSPTGFDCSGLVTYSVFVAKGPDLRLTHNAQKLYDTGEPCDDTEEYRLAFYGPGPTAITHVTLEFGDFTLESAGGGPNTFGNDPNAKVFFHKGRWEGPGHAVQGFRKFPK